MNSPLRHIVLNRLNPLVIAATLLILTVGVRWYTGNCDFSYFITAGDEFVDTASLVSPIHVNEGPGYDGQFFYAFALEPFSAEVSGIAVDHPAYRHQRILYPLLAHLVALGQPQFIPFTLVLINLFSIWFSCLVLLRLCLHFGVHRLYALFACLPAGIVMSLGRDLAEPLEILWLLLCVYGLVRRHFLLFGLSATLCALTRESSLILIFPLSVLWAFHLLKNQPPGTRFTYAVVSKLVFLFMAYPVLVGWKMLVVKMHAGQALIEGANNLGWPLVGLYQGFVFGFRNISGLKDMVEMLIWLANLSWIIWLSVLAFRNIKWRSADLTELALSWSWLSGMLLALMFTYSIYCDDWSFMRVLSGYGIISFLLVLRGRSGMPKLFVLYTFALFALMTVRLWLRV